MTSSETPIQSDVRHLSCRNSTVVILHLQIKRTLLQLRYLTAPSQRKHIGTPLMDPIEKKNDYVENFIVLKTDSVEKRKKISLKFFL